jgi:replication factor C subunit 3/5
MFLIDKYKINKLKDITYHKDIYEKLLTPEKYYLNSEYRFDNMTLDNIDNIDEEINRLKMNNFKNFSNLLIYGPECSGKKTLVKILLNTMYNTEIKTKTEKYTITNYGNTNVSIEVQQSNYHIEIDPTNKGIDKYIIQDIIGQYIKYNGMSLFLNDMKYRIVVINNIQNLSYYAQTSLRRMMEKYVKYCRFIIIGNQISKIIEPLKSRCVPIKMRAPNEYEIFETLLNITQKENIKINIKNIYNICCNSERNIKKAILLLDMYRDLNEVNYTDYWKECIGELVNVIFKFNNKTVSQEMYETINEYLYKIFITTIPVDKILKELLNQILNNIKDTIVAYDIVELAVKYDYRITNGKRSNNHLEGFIYNVIYILNKPT